MALACVFAGGSNEEMKTTSCTENRHQHSNCKTETTQLLQLAFFTNPVSLQSLGSDFHNQTQMKKAVLTCWHDLQLSPLLCNGTWWHQGEIWQDNNVS